MRQMIKTMDSLMHPQHLTNSVLLYFVWQRSVSENIQYYSAGDKELMRLVGYEMLYENLEVYLGMSKLESIQTFLRQILKKMSKQN